MIHFHRWSNWQDVKVGDEVQPTVVHVGYLGAPSDPPATTLLNLQSRQDEGLMNTLTFAAWLSKLSEASPTQEFVLRAAEQIRKQREEESQSIGKRRG